MNKNYFRSFNYSIAVPRLPLIFSNSILSGLLWDQTSWNTAVIIIWLYGWLLPQCAVLFFPLIGWYLMHYMLKANLHIVSKDVYINAHMVIIRNNVELLRLLMIYIEIWWYNYY